MTRAWIDGEDLLVQHPAGAELKQVGARWNKGMNAWRMAATEMNCLAVDELSLPGIRVPRPARPSGALADERLYAYQRSAAYRLAHSKHGMILIAPPGLGKTAVAIAAADEGVPGDQVVVVAPASLLRTWERQIERWAVVPGAVYRMEGKVDVEAATAARWIVVSWEKAVREKDLWGRGWPLFILDESVLTKSRRSARYKALKKMRNGIDRVWELSASPTTITSADLWAQLNLVWPRAFPSFWRFAERYTVTEDNVWSGYKSVVAEKSGRDAVGDNSDLIIVVTEDEGPDLPEYLFEPALDAALAGRQLTAYRTMEAAFIADLGDGTQRVAKNEIGRLMDLARIASYWDGQSAKHDALLDVLPGYDPPYLVWTYWKEGARALSERLRASGLDVWQVDGDTRTKERDAALDSFSVGKLEALVLSIGVGKFGHSFQPTRTIAYVDKTWNADDYFQSLHRVRRIGLGHRPVVLPVRAPGTVDELMDDNIEGKLGVTAKVTRSDLARLLRGLGR